MGQRLNLNIDQGITDSLRDKALALGYKSITELLRAIGTDEVALVPMRQLTLRQSSDTIARNVAAVQKLREVIAALSDADDWAAERTAELAEKDERIAHLEALCESKDAALEIWIQSSSDNGDALDKAVARIQELEREVIDLKELI